MNKLIIIAATLVISSAANAGQRDFSKIDVNQDQKLSLDEFLTHIADDKVERMAGIFNNRDKNEDGFLTENEYTLKTPKY